ncbi:MULTISPECIES: hypothetical protein [Flavobacteriaceae]|uniref:Uncharacterized protein n=2 Tax=Flavobacteriaceae TaxID=49546 RepID=A0A4Y8AVR6_9FLAO|nr:MULTISPECIES: hypothetical protein [Flavobacteriaceae]TEW76636.1 hypothetical protein E2488_01960 [Gramella jeungdoensis]GGK51335.1 hypothetical protein GCM10007963_19610 [Lutibacter litoralis]
MEFFRIIRVKTTEKRIQDKLTIANLESISNELFVIGNQNTTEAEIGSVWGEFTLTRSLIRGGIRLALEECPNALAWTITTGIKPDPEVIVIHLTINRKEQTADFIQEIEAFLDDQSSCLQQYFKATT